MKPARCLSVSSRIDFPEGAPREPDRPSRPRLRRRHASQKARLLKICLGPGGGEEEWRLFHERHGNAVRNVAAGALRASGRQPQGGEIDELCQEVYLRWWRGQSGFDGWTDGAFWRFISTSVRHVISNRRRYFSAAKRRPRPTRVGTPEHDPGPHGHLVLKERRRRVLRHCLEAGSDPDPEHGSRQALALGWVIIGGCTSTEAGKRSGIEPRRIDSLVRRLRIQMANEGIGLPRRGET